MDVTIRYVLIPLELCNLWLQKLMSEKITDMIMTLYMTS